jgi:hypothetical protein
MLSAQIRSGHVGGRSRLSVSAAPSSRSGSLVGVTNDRLLFIGSLRWLRSISFWIELVMLT